MRINFGPDDKPLDWILDLGIGLGLVKYRRYEKKLLVSGNVEAFNINKFHILHICAPPPNIIWGWSIGIIF